MGPEEERVLRRQLWLNEQVYPWELDQCARRWRSARERVERLCGDAEGWEQIFMQDNLVVQAVIMEGLSLWACRIIQSVAHDRKQHPAAAAALAGEAAQALHVVLKRRTAAEHDKFENWYGLDHKFDLEYMYKKTLEFADWLAISSGVRPVPEEARGTAFDYIVHYRFNFNVGQDAVR
ncbi:MAG: hypothetical protein K0R57_1194 [Paenibacillaceae bacterium]|nr:hypothetical protein [Paenibacillaceae bacterium]